MVVVVPYAVTLSNEISAIQQLDRKERRAYETAVEVFPALVKRETKIMDFLRVEELNVKKAAARLAAYWRYRKQLFEERWLLPMTQVSCRMVKKNF